MIRWIPVFSTILSLWSTTSKFYQVSAQTVRSDIFRVEPPAEAAARRTFSRAIDHFNTARWEDALEMFQKTYEHSSHYRGSALLNAGLIQERSGEVDEGARLYWAAAQANDGVVSAAQTRIGLILGRSGESQRALEAFDAAIKADPENIMTKRNRIVPLRHLGRTGA